MARATGYCFHQDLEDEDMQRMVLRNGPVAIALDAGSNGFQFLMGKWQPSKDHCSHHLNHAVLLVGWDEQSWIIKNSWGTNWGIRGFLYLPRGSNMCGVNMMLGVPLIRGVKK